MINPAQGKRGNKTRDKETRASSSAEGRDHALIVGMGEKEKKRKRWEKRETNRETDRGEMDDVQRIRGQRAKKGKKKVNERQKKHNTTRTVCQG